MVNIAIVAFAKKYPIITSDFLGYVYLDQRDLLDRSIEVQAKMVLQLIKVLNLEKAHIIGHNTDGGVFLTLAIKHSEIIDKLVFFRY